MRAAVAAPALLLALLAAPAATSAPPAKDVAPVTVTRTPTQGPHADVQVTIGSDQDHIAGQDVVIWPAAARAAGLGGRVTLACQIDTHGLAETCRVAAEDPPGRGFGAAALALRPVLKLPPKLGPDGEPVDAVQNIAIEYRPTETRSNLTEVLRTGQAVGPDATSNMANSGSHDVNGRNLVVAGNPIDMRRITMLDSHLWAQAPGFEELAAAYPAKGGGVEGYAVAHCKAEPTGELARCVVARETPSGRGFGPAAVALAARFRISPEVMAQAPRGAPVEVDVPVRFPAPAEAGDRIVRRPVWLPGFDPESQMQSFPRQYAKPASPGALVKCVVGADGSLTGCGIELTSPDGIDYDEAAVKYAGRLKMSLWSAEAGPVRGGIVHLPVKVAQP